MRKEELLKKRDALKSRRDVVLEVMEMYTDYPVATQRVLRALQRKEMDGIYGPVAELVFNIPLKVEVAIAAALGETTQYIVLEENRHAQEAIAFLETNNLGRTAFLIRSKLNSRTPETKPFKHKGYLGMAVELIEVKLGFDDVFAYLLGNVHVADCLKTAIELSTKVGPNQRIVTLNGEVVDSSGVMIGGNWHTEKSQILLSRRRILQETERELQDIEQELEVLNRSVDPQSEE